MKNLAYLGLFLALSAVAGAPAAKKVKIFSAEKLEQTLRDAGSLEAEFLQEVYQASLGRTKTSSGSISLSKPDRMRWETYKPEASLTVSNGRKLWYFTPALDSKGKGQVMEHSASRLKEQPVFRLLTGQAQLLKEFRLLEAPYQEGKFRVQLKPVKPMGDLSLVRLEVTDKYLISEILLENKSGNRTKISLQNVKVGSKLPPVLFDFKPPPGAELIQEK